ncbi:hypothetical protein D8I24_4053 (plasmid) [Cupriavidus necator H850]|nr:hypothetical protein D8I24_4053 [Cupriavidus necator H850]
MFPAGAKRVASVVIRLVHPPDMIADVIGLAQPNPLDSLEAKLSS